MKATEVIVAKAIENARRLTLNQKMIDRIQAAWVNRDVDDAGWLEEYFSNLYDECSVHAVVCVRCAILGDVEGMVNHFAETCTFGSNVSSWMDSYVAGEAWAKSE